MKNISLIVSGVLAVIVIYLFVEVKSLKNQQHEQAVVSNITTTSDTTKSDFDLTGLDTVISQNPLSFPVAFVNLDSVTANLEYFKVQADKIEKEMGIVARQLQDKERLLAVEKDQRTKDLQNGTYFTTQQQVANWEQDFQKRVMAFQEESYKYQQEVTQRQLEINSETTKSLKEFLKKYKETRGYSYVLPQSSQADILLYANDALDITEDVTKALNAHYAKLEASDSTATK